VTLKKLLFIALSVAASTLHAQDCPTNLSPCLPGDRVIISSDSFDSSKASLSSITLAPSNGTSVTAAAYGTLDDAHKFWLSVPTDIADGAYSLKVKQIIKANPPGGNATLGDLNDLSPAQIVLKSPSITAISPSAAFFGDQHFNRVTVIGIGFNRWSDAVPDDKAQASIHFQFSDKPTPVACTTGNSTDCLKTELVNDRQIDLEFHGLEGKREYFKSPLKFSIKVGRAWTAPATLTLVDSAVQTPMVVAFLAFVLLLLVVFLLLLSGKALVQKISGKSYFLRALFLDVPTNTYSLSKCQFYVWTAAAVLGYVYLAVSKSYVQGSSVFPDIPPGLPGILLASVGTVVISTGITSAKGDKGAGNPEPSLSDFIASGGIVAPDRLQFVVWTIIGIATFLGIVMLSDPSTVNDLPRIPPGFLQLMGISSAGYLAGKLVRKAGPTINAITVSGSPDKITIQLTGAALSRSALFNIDELPIYPDTIVGPDGKPGLPEIVQNDPSVSDPDYARILKVTIVKAPPTSLGRPHNLTITNPDAQRATWPFQVFKVDQVTIDSATSVLTMIGACLDSNLKVTCSVNGGGSIAITRSNAVTVPNTYEGKINGVNKGDVIVVTVSDNSGMVVTPTVTAT
jgi:hypothetical protein